ncbi:MAG: hypothetical protein JNM69_40575 [Archangium sp.]|nr:hypothetical protein [Archangium sp.]
MKRQPFQRQALLLEGSLDLAALERALRATASFTGDFELYHRSTPSSTWVAFEPWSGALRDPSMSDGDLRRLASRLARGRRVWALTLSSDRHQRVSAFGPAGRPRWAQASKSARTPIGRAAADWSRSARLDVPLRVSLAFGWEPGLSWARLEPTPSATVPAGAWEETSSPRGRALRDTRGRRFVQLTGPLRPFEREAAILEFVRNHGCRATSDRSAAEEELLSNVTSLFELVADEPAYDALLVRARRSEQATGEVLFFGKGFALWRFTPSEPSPSRERRASRATSGR